MDNELIKNNDELLKRMEILEGNVMMIGQMLGIIAKKIDFKHQYIYALFCGISHDVLDEMIKTIAMAKRNDTAIQDLINEFNTKFPKHKNGSIELVKCCKAEGMFVDFCNKFLESPEVQAIIAKFPVVPPIEEK